MHEHLLSRGDLSATDRNRSQHALAQDFLKAGLLDRAEAALRKLEGTAYEAQSRLALLSIYERSRDWPNASEIAHQLESAGQGSFSGRQSHYLCEQAAAQPEAAQGLLEKALSIAPQAARPRIDLAILQQQAGQHEEALNTLLALAESAPAAIPLVADRMATIATAAGLNDSALALLEASYAHTASLDVLEAILTLQLRSGTPIADVRLRYIQHLEREQSLVAAARWIAGEKLEHEEFHPQIQRALDHAANPLKRYRCAACGFEAKQHFWQCPGCQAWDSYPARRVEEL